MKREEAINKVNEGIGSIYTKEDVINLINQIEDTQVETPSFDVYPIVKAVMDTWNQSVQEIFNDLYSNINSDTIINKDECEFDFEMGNKVVLYEVSFDEYEIEAYIDRCRDAVQEFVSKAIVDACTPEQDEDTSIDEQVEQGEQEQNEQ
jgi:hypothetical protein